MDKIYNLWSLLNEMKVEIPIIQRDYAQGRVGKEHLRERFLGKMFLVLSAVIAGKKNEEMTLDFVYGIFKENDAVLYPLDGQQRLTSLWLLYWYIAFKSGNLADNKDILSKFSYETRISSREFCLRLCSLDANDFNAQTSGVVDYIRNQTWFYHRYVQDPTVQGMLRTLAGTFGSNINDGIEKTFKGDIDFFKQCWDILTSAQCPIKFVFHKMNDKDFSLSDDLYIKMNARGKQLTHFENFKADLIGAPDPESPKDKLIDDSNIASKIDNDWTDVFWKVVKPIIYESNHSDNLLDTIYFKFLRDYLFAKFIANDSCTVDALQKNEFYQDVYTDENSDKEYTGFGIYNGVITKGVIEDLSLFFDRWNKNQELMTDDDVRPRWGGETKFWLIPHYSEEFPYSVKKLTHIQRVVSYAVCRYFEVNECFDISRFKDWVQFVWNIAENSDVSTEANMIGAIRLMKEMSPYSQDILFFLASDVQISSKFAERQVAEERFKAKLMLGENAEKWQEHIRKAERNVFLKGNISCLLRKNEEEYVDDIKMFDQKYERICKYFNGNGIKKEYQVSLTKALIASCHTFDQLAHTASWYMFDTSAANWKMHFLNKGEVDYYQEIDKLLMYSGDLDQIEDVKLVDNESVRQGWDSIKDILAKKTFLDEDIVYNQSKWRINAKFNVWLIYPYQGQSGYIFDRKSPDYTFRRNELLRQEAIFVEQNGYPKRGDILGGFDVYFGYKGWRFFWHRENIIYLLGKDNGYIKRKEYQTNEDGDVYFMIDMNKDNNRLLDQDSFLNKLTDLIHENQDEVR